MVLTDNATRAHYGAAPEEGPRQRSRTQDREARRPKIKFTIAIEPGTRKRAFGAVVPDLPGCFSAGDAVEDAFDNVLEAIEAHCELLAEDGKAMPRPKSMSDWQVDREYMGWTWGIVDVPMERFFGPAGKLNITVPGRLLKQIDEHARAHGETRCGFLTKAAHEAMCRT